MSLAMELGNYLEPWLLEKAKQWFEQNLFVPVEIREQQSICVHDEYPFIAGHIDGLAFVDGVYAPILIDAKSTSVYNKKNWDDGEIPAVAMFQIYHYFACLPEIEKAYLVVLIGNTDLRMVEVVRDQEIVDALVKAEVDFWNNHVLPRNPPAMSMVTANDLDVVKKLYPDSVDAEITIEDDEVIAVAKELIEVKARIKELETHEEMLQAQLEYSLGANAGAKAGSYAFSWKSQSRTSVSTKTLKDKYPEIYNELAETSSSRVFRIKEAKK